VTLIDRVRHPSEGSSEIIDKLVSFVPNLSLFLSMLENRRPGTFLVVRSLIRSDNLVSYLMVLSSPAFYLVVYPRAYSLFYLELC